MPAITMSHSSCSPLRVLVRNAYPLHRVEALAAHRASAKHDVQPRAVTDDWPNPAPITDGAASLSPSRTSGRPKLTFVRNGSDVLELSAMRAYATMWLRQLAAESVPVSVLASTLRDALGAIEWALAGA